MPKRMPIIYRQNAIFSLSNAISVRQNLLGCYLRLVISTFETLTVTVNVNRV